MVLPLPALSLAVEGNIAVQLHPGHVDSQQALPLSVALGGGQLRVLVDDVLEVVHHGAVGDEGDGVGQVAVAELALVRAEEAGGVHPAEELHAHGVDLAGLHAGPGVLSRDALAVHPVGEGVACLVGNHLHVTLGAVEVGEDEGRLVIGDAGAVAAGLLALGGQDVQQLAIQHVAEELAGLRGQLVVELPALGQDVVSRAHRTGVAAAELQRRVGEAQGIRLAQEPGLLLVDILGHGHQVLLHGLAELLHVLLGVAVAAHAVVTQGGVALVAQLSAHLIAQVDQLIVEIVQLRLVVLVPPALGLPGGQAAPVVAVGLEGGQLGQGVDLALKGDLSGGQQLLVLLGQLVLLLHLRDDLRGEGLELDLGVDEHQLAVLGGEVGTVGAFHHSHGPGLGVLLHLRDEGVPELLLIVVELVAGVDGVADAGQGRHGLDVPGVLFLLQEDGLGLSVVGSILQPRRQLPQPGLDGLGVGAGILHFRKLHTALLFS